jgi:superfamily I DNA/RNA helicase
MDKMAELTNAQKMPLSICYRCGKSIVALCATLVPTIEPWDKAEDGLVESINEEKMLQSAKPGDYIISRVNAPLVAHCLRFLREGRKAKIAGKDMGRSLMFFIKNSEATSINELIDYTESWKAREIERLSAKKRDFAYVCDRADTILAFAENAMSLEQLKTNISSMFDDTDEQNYIRLTSCHRVKGREGDRCFVLRKTFKPEKSKEELNLAYVAFSRAQKELYLVE